MKKILFLGILFLFIHTLLLAQRRVPQELIIKIQGKTKLADIMTEVNRYYDFGRANIQKSPGEDDFESNDYEWWKKWEYWERRRLNPDGTLADYRTLNFLKRFISYICYAQSYHTKTFFDERFNFWIINRYQRSIDTKNQ